MDSMEKWQKILGWNRWPTFGYIHQDRRLLLAYYYVPDNLQEVIDQIRFCLQTKITVSDKLLIGEPGSGKTTFLYYLRAVLFMNSGEFANQYYMHILHFNRIVGSTDEESAECVVDRCLETYVAYFRACGLDQEVDAVLRNGQLNKSEKINRLLDSIVREKDKFQKQLLIVIDDVDEAEQEQVQGVLPLLYSYMEPVSIQKWLSVRETTLVHYPSSLVKFIRTKFPETIPFPKVDLYGIIEKRIKTTNPDGKNPFTRELCNLVGQACNRDLRVAITIFPKFLQLNDPGNIGKSTDEKFIASYFKVTFGKTLVLLKQFPNIYLHSVSAYYPIEKDAFCLLCVKRQVDRSFFSILQKYYQSTVAAVQKASGDKTRVLPLTRADVRRAIRFLIDNQLVVEVGEQHYALTYSGTVFANVIHTPKFVEGCREGLRAEGERRTSVYWQLAEIEPEFFDAVLAASEGK